MDRELELCRIALKERQADAMDRVDRLAAKIADDIRRLKETEKVYERAQVGAGTYAASEYLAKIERVRRDGKQAADRLDALTALVKQYGQRTLDRLGGETAEQALLRQIGGNRYSDPVLRLLAKDKLTVEHVLSAREIAAICEHVSRGASAKTTYFPIATPDEQPIDSRGKREAFQVSMERGEYMALLHGYVYLGWADKVRKEQPDKTMELVLGLCVEGCSVEELRRQHRLDWSTVLDRIKAALDAYSAIRAGFNPERPEKAPRVPQAGAVLPIPALSKS
jgi:hypothetical protein